MWVDGHNPAIENNDGTVYRFNQDFCPLSDFDVTVDERLDDSRDKMQTHGLWPTFTYRGGMTINLQGNLLADSMEDYVSKRLDLVQALYGNNFDDLVSEPQMGIYRMLPLGYDDIWEVPYAVRAFSSSKTWTEGAYSPFLVTLFAFRPFFTGHIFPSQKYRWA